MSLVQFCLTPQYKEPVLPVVVDSLYVVQKRVTPEDSTGQNVYGDSGRLVSSFRHYRFSVRAVHVCSQNLVTVCYEHVPVTVRLVHNTLQHR